MTVIGMMQRDGRADPDLYEASLSLALAYVNNALSDARRRAAAIPLTNARLKATLLAINGGLDLLKLAGFTNTGESLRLTEDTDTIAKLQYAKLFLQFEMDTWTTHRERMAGICKIFVLVFSHSVFVCYVARYRSQF